MFESFKNRAKKEESESSGGPALSRRAFLGGAAAVAGVLAVDGAFNDAEAGKEHSLRSWYDGRMQRMQYKGLSELPPEKREKLIGHEVRVFGKFLRSTEGQHVLNEGTDEELSLLMRSMPALLSAHIRDTKFDVTKEHWPSVAVDFKFDADGNPQIYDPRVQPEYVGKRRCGNGFALDDQHIVTNWHVIDTQVQSYKRTLVSTISIEQCEQLVKDVGVDAVLARIPHSTGNGPRPPLSFQNQHDSDVEGALVCVAGFDPDESCEAEGVKRYPSLAIKMTPRLVSFLRLDSSDPTLLNSFVIVLPPGESKHRIDSDGNKYIRAQGMSGSPVMMDGAVTGIIHSVLSHEDQVSGVTIDVGFFHGPDALNTVLSNNIMYEPQPQAAATSLY